MLVKSEGIVLKQIPYSETSIIVKIFTREFGLLSFLIKGARGKSNKASLYKPINRIHFSFNYRENKTLFQISECQLLFAPDAMNFGIFKSAISMMMIELLNQTIHNEAQHDEYKYDFITLSFEYLIENSLHQCYYLSFLYQYAQQLGIDIPLDNLSKNPQIYLIESYSSSAQMSISKLERKAIFNAIEHHFKENISNYKNLKSIGILEEVL